MADPGFLNRRFKLSDGVRFDQTTVLTPSVWTSGWGCGGGGGVGRVTSYIWHSTYVRAEWPPFSALPGI